MLHGDSRAPERAWLVFRVGPYTMCASALDVEGVIQCPPILAKLPFTPDYALGAFLFRGTSAAAISLRKRLRIGESYGSATAPFIVTRIAEGAVAFRVDEVMDVIGESDADWRPVPAMMQGGLFDRFAVRDDRVLLQTTFAALLHAKVHFQPLDAWAARPGGAGNPEPASPPADQVNELNGARVGSEQAKTVEMPPADPRWSAQEDRLPESHAISVRHTPPAAPLVVPTRLSRKPDLRTNAAFRARLDDQPRARPATKVPARKHDYSVDTPQNPPRVRSVPSDNLVHVRPSGCPTSPSTPIAWNGLAAGAAALAVVAMLYGLLGVAAGGQGGAAPRAAAVVSPSEEAINIAPPHRAAPVGEQAAPVKTPEIVLTIQRHSEKPAVLADMEAAAPDSRVHIVVPGDTLWGIAKAQIGDPFRYPELAKLSNISNADLIHPGDAIRIEIRK